MPLLVAMPLFLLIGLAAAAAAYYGVVLGRVIRSTRSLPTLRHGLAVADAHPPHSPWPRIVAIVPAHNEEDVIEAHARSVAAQDYPEFHAVFSLDRCTDRTEEIVRRVIAEQPPERRARLSVHLVRDCPPGWAGKVHAIHSAAAAHQAARDAAAEPDLLLFADADTVLDPRCLRAAVALLRQRGLGLLSLLGTLTREGWFGSIVQPAAGFELLRQFPLDAVNRGDKPRAFANGQFMLWDRRAYEITGGHEAVKSELLEDIAFARRLQAARRGDPGAPRWGVFLADGLMTCRMYRTWEAFTRGWKRIYTESAHRRPGRLARSSLRVLLTGVLLAPAGPAALIAGSIVLARPDPPLGWALVAGGTLGTLAAWIALAVIYRAQRTPIAWLLLYPLGAFLVSRLLRRAAKDLTRGRATRWAGREYAREVRA